MQPSRTGREEEERRRNKIILMVSFECEAICLAPEKKNTKIKIGG
jgi:hypothetical protein